MAGIAAYCGDPRNFRYCSFCRFNKADIYVETTSAVNQDGYAGEVVRTFWVACTGDLVNSIEGLYTSTVIRNGAVNPQYFDLSMC